MKPPLLAWALAFGLMFVSQAEAFAGRGAPKYVPKRMPSTPSLRHPHIKEGRVADAHVLDAIAEVAVDCPEQHVAEVQAVWQQQVDRVRAELGEDGFRDALQERGLNIDDFFSAEPSADFVSVRGINYDGLLRSWRRAQRVNRHWERADEQENKAVEAQPKEITFIDRLINLFCMGVVFLIIMSFFRAAGRRLMPLLSGV